MGKYCVHVSYVGYFVSLGFVVIGLPLALNLVEPNGWYGIRISTTSQSAEAWYDINCIAGWTIVIVGIFVTISIHCFLLLISSV
ncbi:MAG: SdpI family protein [Paraglaciecola sp.]|nr:SdpI family protein [Paraglaciecola sp.]